MKRYFSKFVDVLRGVKHALSTPAMRRLPKTDWLEIEIKGIKWRLCLKNQIDKEIALHVFEPITTNLVKKIVKPGMRVMDIGANIGYYTSIMGKLVGRDGEVWAFEPVEKFRKQIIWHVMANHLEGSVNVLDCALSNIKGTGDIIVDNISASMQYVGIPAARDPQSELIRLETLDNINEELDLPRINFIKIDTDGHEPFVLKGAEKLIKRHQPIMVIEFAQLWLDVANSDVRELKEIIESYGYTLFSERTLRPFETRRDFLTECGNFSQSANVWAVPEKKIRSLSELF